MRNRKHNAQANVTPVVSDDAQTPSANVPQNVIDAQATNVAQANVKARVVVPTYTNASRVMALSADERNAEIGLLLKALSRIDDKAQKKIVRRALRARGHTGGLRQRRESMTIEIDD